MYAEQYQAKLTTPAEAAAALPNGAVVIPGMTMAEPPALLQAISDRVAAGGLEGLTMFCLMPTVTVCSCLLSPELCDRVTVHTWFVSPWDQELVDQGREDFIPCHFHQVPRLIMDGPPVDACVTIVSPMDEKGYFSFGVANDYTSTAARKAKMLMVEVNRFMPRVFGQGLLHVTEVSHIVENHTPLRPYLDGPPKEEDQVIGQRVAEMVPDGACLQLGVGSLPAAAASCLGDHKDLGVHTEVFGPSMVRLIQQGVINGRKKNLHPGLHVFTVAEGDQNTMDFLDNNPAMASFPVSYVNNPGVIAANERMISVNSLLQVDLTGQCNAEFLAGHQISGTGGQLDYVRGAYDSPGGRSILAFRSTAKEGAVSRVVPRLEPGAAVTTPRMDVHWLVTEYGAVNMKGMSTHQRARAIIGLAHPKHREDLERAARELRLA